MWLPYLRAVNKLCEPTVKRFGGRSYSSAMLRQSSVNRPKANTKDDFRDVIWRRRGDIFSCVLGAGFDGFRIFVFSADGFGDLLGFTAGPLFLVTRCDG